MTRMEENDERRSRALNSADCAVDTGDGPSPAPRKRSPRRPTGLDCTTNAIKVVVVVGGRSSFADSTIHTHTHPEGPNSFLGRRQTPHLRLGDFPQLTRISYAATIGGQSRDRLIPPTFFRHLPLSNM